MAGLALSIAVLVVVVSVVNGFERELRDRLLGQLPHIALLSRSPQAADSELRERLQKRPDVRSVAPVIQGAGMIVGAQNTDKPELGAVQISGIDTKDPAVVARLAAFVRAAVDGVEDSANDRLLLVEGRFDILLGRTIARDLGIAAGDRVTLVLPQVSLTPAGLIPRQKRVRVAGLIDSQSELDGRVAYLMLADAQRLFRLGERIHGYELRLVDLFEAQRVAVSLNRQFGSEGYYARSWLQSYGNLYQAILIQKQTMFILLSFLIAVAAFNLVSGLLMVGEQRRGDVAILLTMGMPRAGFLLTFGTLGVLLGGLGIVIGVTVGVLVAVSLPPLFETLINRFQLELMSEYFVNYLPVDVRATDLLSIATVSLLLALASALYPAWRLSRQRPVEVLAHE